MAAIGVVRKMQPSITSKRRRHRRLAVVGLLLLVVGLSGCKAPQATEQPAQMQGSSSAQAKDSAMDSRPIDPASALDAVLKKGMAYGDFRRLVLAKGWQPVVNPECKANLVGAGADDLCAKNPQLTSCRICGELPELDSCSSDAHCLMRFRHPDATGVLEVTGYGEVAYWNDTGEDAGLQVTGWELTESEGK
jgi:hypothetical protein